MAVHRVLLLGVLVFLPLVALGGGDTSVNGRFMPWRWLDFEFPNTSASEMQCQPMAGATKKDLKQLVDSNCGKVEEAAEDFKGFADRYGKALADSWEERLEKARHICDEATRDSKADLAVHAWGDVLMAGKECCKFPYPPYCVSSTSSKLGNVIPLVIMVLVLLFSLIKKLLSGSPTDSLLFFGRPRPTTVQTGSSPPADNDHGDDWILQPLGNIGDLEAKLSELWHASSLANMDPQGQIGPVVCKTFFDLYQNFGFQAHSVRNQFEHLLSLWRSHCAMLLDSLHDQSSRQRHVTELNNSRVLLEGLAEFHKQFLEGFRKWRLRCAMQEGSDPEQRPEGEAKFGDVRHALEIKRLQKELDSARTASAKLQRQVFTAPGPEDGDAGREDEASHLAAQIDSLEKQIKVAEAEQSTQMLRHLAAFLLVWGEASNLRFMPEALYFITDLLLDAELDARPTPSHQGNMFLVTIIRPIYNVIFNELYTARLQGDKEVVDLHPGFKAFIPADTNNYDDWNEFFLEPGRVAKSLKFPKDSESEEWQEQKELSAEDRGKRFWRLESVDWDQALRGCKTHREIHTLWGVFASTHRLWLLQALLFCLSYCYVSQHRGDQLKGGGALLKSLEGVGLLVPFFTICWLLGLYLTTGRAVWGRIRCDPWFTLTILWKLLPLATYVVVHVLKHNENWMCLHAYVWLAGAMHSLALPTVGKDRAEKLTPVPWAVSCQRWLFWILLLAVKVSLGMHSIYAMSRAIGDLKISTPGQLHHAGNFQDFAFSPSWTRDMTVYIYMMGTSVVLYLADMQPWFALLSSFVGVLVAFKQRGWDLKAWGREDTLVQVPRLFAQKVLYYDQRPDGEARKLATHGSRWFPSLWDKVIEHMRYESQVDPYFAGFLTYSPSPDDKMIKWAEVKKPPVLPSRVPKPAQLFDTPIINGFQRAMSRFGGLSRHTKWPENKTIQWRLTCLSSMLSLKIPRPFQVPDIPGLTVLIPHYSEETLLATETLCRAAAAAVTGTSTTGGAPRAEGKPLISWLQLAYPDEFSRFASRMLSRNYGDNWSDYDREDWELISMWASLRSQTVWRTVAGMMLYHQALEAHEKVQGNRDSLLYQANWVQEVFRCVLSSQQYTALKPQAKAHISKMLDYFENTLHIAFIYSKRRDKPPSGGHPTQRHTYYSCLFNKDCNYRQSEDRNYKDYQPSLVVELPGFPIMGEGKPENQNHALPFTRGTFLQTIDANQGAYFEQMLMLPCVLGEFRNAPNKIVGLPEHIFSDVGAMGGFAAFSETAFNSVLQRAYCAMGVRMHYGHPDIHNKEYMMQQGGVSKAGKTINLSEDIFAGLEFTLRGEGRTIVHAEYMFLAKGRDMGFNQVLGFFSKLSSGTGEQLLTRQAQRLGEILPLPQFLSLWFAHGGHYMGQFFISRSVPLLVDLWLMVVLSGGEANLGMLDPRAHAMDKTGAVIMAEMLVTQFGWVLVLFLVAGTVPFVLQYWQQYGVAAAVQVFLRNLLTLSPLYFPFQAKVIGHYIWNEFFYGGASYVATGRGLPVDRKPFMELYKDWAGVALYDGTKLLAFSILALSVGGLDVDAGMAQSLKWWGIALGLTISSWLLAPFVFNPYHFDRREFIPDLRDWKTYFYSRSKMNSAQLRELEKVDKMEADKEKARFWSLRYKVNILKPGTGITYSPTAVISWMILLAPWYVVVAEKMHILSAVFSSSYETTKIYLMTCLPPIISSSFLCLGVVLMAVMVQHRRQEAAAAAVVAAAAVAALQPAASGNQRLPQDQDTRAGCPHAVSLLLDGEPSGRLLFFVSLAVVCCDAVEAAGFLHKFALMEWWKTHVAGLIFKFYSLSMFVTFAENLFRTLPENFFSREAPAPGAAALATPAAPTAATAAAATPAAATPAAATPTAAPPAAAAEPAAAVPASLGLVWTMAAAMKLWLYAHRMAADMAVSALLLLVLSPGVLFELFRTACCGFSCSPHNLLVFGSGEEVTERERV